MKNLFFCEIKYSLISCVWLVLLPVAKSQQLFQRPYHDYVWIFGDYEYSQRLDFNSISPSFNLIDRVIEFAAANTSICSSQGELILYSNGFRVLNGQQQYLTNGYRINQQYDYTEEYVNEGFRITQGLLSLPSLEDTSSYYLFYTEPINIVRSDGATTVTANKVYMAEASFSQTDQGVVVEEDFVLINDTLGFGKMTACRHGNGRDWWFLVPNQDNKLYNRLLITPTGIENLGTIAAGDSLYRGVGQ
ncbi:MAG: hypothetical protein AAFO02_22780, partial [Bacteroidota bacterium]